MVQLRLGKLVPSDQSSPMLVWTLTLIAEANAYSPPVELMNATVGIPSKDQCYTGATCYIPGAKCECCLKKYAYKEYSDEICFAYYKSDGEAKQRRQQRFESGSAGSPPCFDTDDCFGGPARR